MRIAAPETIIPRRFVFRLDSARDRAYSLPHDAISQKSSRRQGVEIQLGGVMAHVVMQVGANLIESVITRRSADEMKLKVGDKVSAVIKSTEVMLEKD